MQQENKTPQTEKNKGAAAPTPPLPMGSVLSSSALAKLGGSTLALDADVSGELAALAPTFGDVLSSIGNGVARSQEALDRGLVQTARTLSDTNITIVTDVIQELNDDGLPVPEATELVEETVSLINFVRPTAHEWSHVALSMDLSVGALDEERGMTFRNSMSSRRATNVGLFFGFLGIGVSSFKESSSFRSSESEFEANWAEGRVRMDAMLRPRNVEGFDPPATVTIGPQLFVSQGAVRETVSQGVVTARAIDLLITARKADGSVNPNVGIIVDSGPFDLSFAATDGFTGDQTNSQGQCRITLSRSIPSALFQGRVRGSVKVNLGQVEKRQTISL
jgi:hypothetical protein